MVGCLEDQTAGTEVGVGGMDGDGGGGGGGLKETWGCVTSLHDYRLGEKIQVFLWERSVLLRCVSRHCGVTLGFPPRLKEIVRFF